MGIAERLKLLRHMCQFTVREAATLLGVSSGYVSLLEGGSRHPSEKLVKRIASSIGVDPHWLRTGLGWVYTRGDSYEWLTSILPSAVGVEFIVILSGVSIVESGLLPEDDQEYLVAGRLEKGLLAGLPGGVISARIGSVTWENDQDPTTQDYRAVLKVLRDWGGKVGRIALSAWEASRIEQLDLSSFLNRAVFADWIIDDELARLRPRGAILDSGACSGPVPVTPARLQSIAQRDPSLAAIIEILEDSDAITRDSVYKFLHDRHETNLRLAESLATTLDEYVRRSREAPRISDEPAGESTISVSKRSDRKGIRRPKSAT